MFLPFARVERILAIEYRRDHVIGETIELPASISRLEVRVESERRLTFCRKFHEFARVALIFNSEYARLDKHDDDECS